MRTLSLVCLSVLLSVPASAGVSEELSFPVSDVKALQPAFEPGVIFDSGFSTAEAEALTGLLVRGSVPGNAKIEVEVMAGRDSKWMKADVKQYPNGYFFAGAKIPSLAGAQYRYRVLSSVPGASVLIYTVEPITAAMKESRAAKSNKRHTVKDLRLYGINVISREEWGAVPAKGDYTEHSPAKITIHHTAQTWPSSVAESYEVMRQIQEEHINSPSDPYIDIGYHYVIDPFGNIFEGRPVWAIGAHTYANNTNNVGISFMGYFHAPYNHVPTPAALATLNNLVYAISQAYGIPTSKVFGHRDFNATACPGDILYPVVGQIRAGQAPSVSGKTSLSPRAETPAVRMLREMAQ